MLIYPAIDLFEGKAVRLFKGDYAKMTVYNDDPLEVARDFEKQGATCIHLVDLEGAKNGKIPNFDIVKRIKAETSLLCEIGGGIRSMEVVDAYIEAGLDRVILGTAAVQNPEFAREAAEKYGDKIAVGVDIKDGYVAVKGWTEKSAYTAIEFCKMMESIGIKTLISTDISKDGAMQGSNVSLYDELSQELHMNIIASGGVSSMEDIYKLAKLDIHGAIIGKAYYTGAISLKEAIEAAK
ncbi:MAG: 1-(5-phosphoribosyl)-5-[(5-phosphoribosylamino)methylideneamino]imidazole-4-carboxamide isomerase [Ruminococcaceae bacterium]|nr:1-(5-phosphoribosyl)-5-[(5-phosphoribosylamino)methylideneamino]imidazole-4-carboxamide isomerase [Oscillospiraceae bacterium]